MRPPRQLCSVVLAVAVLMSGCDGGDNDDPAVSVPNPLRSAERVDGVAVGGAESQIGSASPCGVDSAEAWTGADNENTMRYSRDSGVEVVIGVWSRGETYAERALDTIQERIDSPYCRRHNGGADATTWSTRPLDELPGSAVGFETVVNYAGPFAGPDDEANAGRHSILRAYAFVDGSWIMVWMEQKGQADPDPADLRRLLDAQIEAV